MARKTAFPGIWVESIRVQEPPYPKKGQLKEVVGRGVTHDFDRLQRAAELTDENIIDYIEGMKEMIDVLGDKYRVQYTLLVRSVSRPFNYVDEIDLFMDMKGRTVSARARTFVRAKNPFEPNMVEVGIPQYDRSLSGDKLGEVHRVKVTVSK